MLQPKKWWVGLPVLAGIIYLAGDALARRIEIDLSNRAAQLLAREKGALDGAEVVANGRDLAVSGRVLSPSGRDTALLAIRQIEGVRDALDHTQPVETVHPFVLKMERKGLRVVLEGNVPPAGERDKLLKELALQGLEVVDHAGYAMGAPAAFPEFVAFAARRVGEMDPAVVTLTDEAISLEGAATPDADLDKLIADAKAPPAGARIATLAIDAAPKVSPYEWSARKDGVITLEGFVPTSIAKARGERKAIQIAVGAPVDDRTKVGAGALDKFAGAVDAALTQLGKLTKGKVALHDAEATIEGEARSNVTAAMIEGDLKAHLPQGFSLAKIVVVDGPASPFAFVASLNDGALTLAGNVPAAKSHEEIHARAQNLFSGVALTDTLGVANGAPPAFEQAIAVALPSLARLANGRLTLSDSAVLLVGEAPFEGVAADIRARLASALPQGFSATIQLAARTLGPPLDSGERQRTIDDALAHAPPLFEGADATLADGATPTLDALAALLLRCPGATFEVVGHATGAPGAEEAIRGLATQRARAVIERLTALGLDPANLAPVGVAAPAQPGAGVEAVAK